MKTPTDCPKKAANFFGWGISQRNKRAHASFIAVSAPALFPIFETPYAALDRL